MRCSKRSWACHYGEADMLWPSQTWRWEMAKLCFPSNLCFMLLRCLTIVAMTAGWGGAGVGGWSLVRGSSSSCPSINDAGETPVVEWHFASWRRVCHSAVMSVHPWAWWVRRPCSRLCLNLSDCEVWLDFKYKIPRRKGEFAHPGLKERPWQNPPQRSLAAPD